FSASIFASILILRLAPVLVFFPYTTLFRSLPGAPVAVRGPGERADRQPGAQPAGPGRGRGRRPPARPLHDRPLRRRVLGHPGPRSEEHTSELQSRFDLVCRLLLEKKKIE